MTQPTFFVEEDKIITALFEEGLDTLHINKPDSEPLYAERLLSLLPKSCYDDIVVHQHYYLKQEYDLKGIHINDPATPTPEGFRKHVTRSTSNIDDLKAMKKQCDYVMLLHSLPIDEMKQARKNGLIDKKVYALGGMTLENIQMAKDLGFGGVVICGDLWNRFSIQHESNFHALIEHFRKLKKAVG